MLNSIQRIYSNVTALKFQFILTVVDDDILAVVEVNAVRLTLTLLEFDRLIISYNEL